MMAFCENCGGQVQDGVKFCPSCGKQAGAQAGAAPAQTQAQPVQQAPANDTEANKGMAVLSYIIFFIPLLMGKHKESPFVKYHVNQGIILFGLAVAYGIVSVILRAIIRTEVMLWGIPTGVYTTPGWLGTILWIGSVGITALCVMGVVNAVKGKMKPLPIIGGKFVIIK